MNDPIATELLGLYQTLLQGQAQAMQMGIIPAEAHFSFEDFGKIEQYCQVIELAGLRLVPNQDVPNQDIYLYSKDHRNFVRMELKYGMRVRNV